MRTARRDAERGRRRDTREEEEGNEKEVSRGGKDEKLGDRVKEREES